MKRFRLLHLLTGAAAFLMFACNQQEKLVNTSKEAFYLTMEGDTGTLKGLFQEDYLSLFQDRFRVEVGDAQRYLEEYYFDEEPGNIIVYQDQKDESLHVIDIKLKSKIKPGERAVFRYCFHGKEGKISSFHVLPELLPSASKLPDSPSNQGLKAVRVH